MTPRRVAICAWVTLKDTSTATLVINPGYTGTRETSATEWSQSLSYLPERVTPKTQRNSKSAIIQVWKVTSMTILIHFIFTATCASYSLTTAISKVNILSS